MTRRAMLGAALALPFAALAQPKCGASTPRELVLRTERRDGVLHADFTFVVVA